MIGLIILFVEKCCLCHIRNILIFKFFSDGQPMYDLIQRHNAETGLSRMIATADYPFTVLDGKTWYVQAGSLRLPWDKLNFTDRPWAQRPETLHEVGSIYTIQGFDLN